MAAPDGGLATPQDPVPGSASPRQSLRRSFSGLFRRRHDGRTHYRTCQDQILARYQGTKTPLPQIAKELRVDAVVEGSVVRSGDKLRITAQLIEANTDKHLWAESYERNFNDVLTLQREVASAITGQVNATLTSAESSRLAGKVAVNSQEQFRRTQTMLPPTQVWRTRIS
jgi:hypothetical protein